ncbi:MAG: hypothetical protein ACI4SM_03230 [Candidatus Gastranaerophilaceae bacterium]
MLKVNKLILVLIFLISLAVPARAFEIPFTKGIIFNSEPFTRESVGNYGRYFPRGDRIYWLFMSKRPIKANYIKIQIVKVTDKGPWNTVSDVVYTHDYKILKDSPYYFTDYFVLHSGGHYYMEIFDRSKLQRPMVVADFYVK